jgi:MFS family permease
LAERIGRLRWWIIALVTLGTILNYLARSSLSVAAPTLMDVFDMDTQQYSYVVFAFQAAYTGMQTFAGAILDFLGTGSVSPSSWSAGPSPTWAMPWPEGVSVSHSGAGCSARSKQRRYRAA